MPLSPECYLGSDPILRRQALYEAFGGEGCFLGLSSEEQEFAIYESMGGSECFRGLPQEDRRYLLYVAAGGSDPCFSGSSPQEQDALFYEALYEAAGDTSLVDPACFRGLSPDERWYWTFRAALLTGSPHPECVAIEGATNSTYETTEDDTGFWIRARVTATNSEGSDSAWSNAVGPVEAAVGGGELVVNGGFELFTGTQDDGITDTFTGWTNDNGGNVANKLEASTTVHGGLNALKLTLNTATPGVSQEIVVTASTNYRLTFWTRADGTNPSRYSVVDQSNAADIQAFGSTGVSGTNYELVTLDFATPPGCVLVQLNFYSGSGAAIAYFDDISLVLN